MNNGIEKLTTWAKIKDLYSKGWLLMEDSYQENYDGAPTVYEVFAVNDVASFVFKVKLTSGTDDCTEFVNDYLSKCNLATAIRPALTTSQNAIKVSPYIAEGTQHTIVSHNFCDRTTWYTQSAAATDETLTPDGAYTVYSSANPYWIDLTHGKVTEEDTLVTTYPITVKLNDVEQTSGFTIDYSTGTVTFDSALTDTDVVKASYSYAQGSEVKVIPPSEKIMRIEHTEVQFTQDVTMADGVHFEIWVYNPYDLPNKVMYAKKTYKNVLDLINGGTRGTGYIPKCDLLNHDVLVFPFKYLTSYDLADSTGAELRIHLTNDTPFVGDFATVTVYALEVDE